MGGERLKIILSLTPPLLIIFTLFFGGIFYGFLQSLGYQPAIGKYEINFSAYYNVMFSERYAKLFWTGLGLNLWVSFASTFLAAVFALFGALAIRKTFFAKTICNFIYSLNLPMPHLVVAVGIIFVFSQSGLLARLASQIGLIGSPGDFPVLVKDKYGLGIILAYIWKEAAFFFIILMSVLQSLGENFEELAQSLGANRWQIIREVIFPNSLPEILTGVRVAAGMCWGTLVAAEFLAGTTGIGFVENVARKYMQYEVIWITIFVMGMLGLLFDVTLRKIIDKTTPWHGKG